VLGLGIKVLHFLKKKKNMTFSAIKFFPFLISNPWIQNWIRNRIDAECGRLATNADHKAPLVSRSVPRIYLATG
jgi:hypothetical protein